MSNVVFLLFEVVCVQYGVVFDEVIVCNVVDVIVEDVGVGDQIGWFVLVGEYCCVWIIVCEEVVLCGVLWFEVVIVWIDLLIVVYWCYCEGDWMMVDLIVCEFEGLVCVLLMVECNGLNFLQLLLGVVMVMCCYVDCVEGMCVKIFDMCKMLLGLWFVQKYVVWVGGGENQCFVLYDGILIKENYIVVVGGVGEVFDVVFVLKLGVFVQVEVEMFVQFDMVFVYGVQLVLFDNFMFDMMCEVVCVVDGKVVFEVLGGVNFEMVCMFVEMGVDCILIGVLMKDVWVIDYLMWIVD